MSAPITAVKGEEKCLVVALCRDESERQMRIPRVARDNAAGFAMKMPEQSGKRKSRYGVAGRMIRCEGYRMNCQ